MKSSFIKLSVWIGLSALVACNDVDTPKYDLQATPELAPLAQPALVLNEASSGFIAETFSWSSGDYGFPAAPVYTLEPERFSRSYTISRIEYRLCFGDCRPIEYGDSYSGRSAGRAL